MNTKDLQALLELRKHLIQCFEKCKDYKNNPNAIMKEFDHVNILAESIKKIDVVLRDHVTFS